MRISDWSSDVCSSDLLKHLFAQNPLGPAVWETPIASEVRQFSAMKWVKGAEGIVAVGHCAAGFAFDCEGPRHEVLLAPHAPANRPVSTDAWHDFIADGAYHPPPLWPSDSWAWVPAA